MDVTDRKVGTPLGLYPSFLKRAEAAFWPVLSSLGKDEWRRSICESTMWVALAVAKVKTCFFTVAGAGRWAVLSKYCGRNNTILVPSFYSSFIFLFSFFFFSKIKRQSLTLWSQTYLSSLFSYVALPPLYIERIARIALLKRFETVLFLTPPSFLFLFSLFFFSWDGGSAAVCFRCPTSVAFVPFRSLSWMAT